MGRRAHVQIRQPEYGVCEFTDHAQEYAERYLDENEINVFTGGEHSGVKYADHWEIEIPWKDGGPDYGVIQSLIDDLRAHPEKICGDGDEEWKCGDVFAALLEEGLESAMKNKYDWIFIDWF